ncbi:MAG: F0F1 ATP synthase subunit delta [Methylocystaceae bacterium]
MLNKSVARRYAEAIFSIAQEVQSVDSFETELIEVASLLEASSDLAEYLYHPLIPARAKRETAEQLFADRLSSSILDFIKLVIDKRRERYLVAISEEYTTLADEARNIIKAELTTAMPLSDAEINEITTKLSASTGKNIRLQVKIDPSLLGGIKIRVGDRVIDASVAKKLAMLKSDMSKAKISTTIGVSE